MSGGEDMVVVAKMVLKSDLKAGQVLQGEIYLSAKRIFFHVLSFTR